MHFLENIRLALSSLKANKLRSVLTMLGIIIGISSVVTITTIGNSLKDTLNSTLNMLEGQSVNTYYDYIREEDLTIEKHLSEEDYIKTMVDYLMFKEEIDVKELRETISNKVIYLSDLSSDDKNSSIGIDIERGEGDE